MMKHFIFILLLWAGLDSIYAQYRPSLFFKEDWKETPAEIPVSQNHIANSEVVLHLYGPGKDSLKKSHHTRPVDDPYYLWSGLCKSNWAVTFSHKDKYADLSSFAKVKLRTKQAGYRQLRLVLGLEDGAWLVSDKYIGPSDDWKIQEIIIENITWRSLDIQNIYEKEVVTNPDLSRVKEIGFTDLMRGGRSRACSRIDWIEVYGFPVDP